MKITFSAFDRIPPEKVGEAVQILYEYLDDLSGGKLRVQGMSLYIPLRDEDGDVVSMSEGDMEVYWEVRTEPRQKEGSERNLIYEGKGIYIYRHLKHA